MVEILSGTDGGRPGGVVRQEAGARSSAARNHQRGRIIQSEEKGRRSDRQGSDGEVVRGVQGKLERETFGSASRGMEWDSARKRPQRTGQEKQN